MCSGKVFVTEGLDVPRAGATSTRLYDPNAALDQLLGTTLSQADMPAGVTLVQGDNADESVAAMGGADDGEPAWQQGEG